MKKYLPLILLGVGFLVIVGVFFLVRGRGNEEQTLEEEEIALLDVALNDRPVASLTPSSDGHYLYLKISKIKIEGAETLDYELLYQTSEGVTQGVPGTVKMSTLESQGEVKSFSSELLLGSESSGKFRYDEGVEKGSLTLRFRNSDGKLLVKFATEFVLKNNITELKFPTDSFNVKFSKPVDGFVLLMETFGLPESSQYEVVNGPFGLFTSVNLTKISGNVDLSSSYVYMHTESGWTEFADGGKFSTDSGVFIGSSE